MVIVPEKSLKIGHGFRGKDRTMTWNGNDYDDLLPHVWKSLEAARSRQPMVQDAAVGQHESLNRLSAVIDNNLTGTSTTTNYTYDSASNVYTVTYSNSVQSTFTYDPMNRVTGLSSQPATYTYHRDFAGNLTTLAESSGRNVSWGCDGIYRLTNETIGSSPSGKDGVVSYGLDSVGNRTSATSTIADVAPVSGAFNLDDELASENYDQNGNVTGAGGKRFSYDSQNQLISMNGGAVQLIYDGDGNRVAKTVLTNGVPTTTYYLVDDLNPTGYPQVVEELQGGTVIRQYTYGLQRINQNQQISGAWTPSFYGYDGGGNVRQLTNSAGTVTDSYEYDAFGNEFTVSGSTPNNYLYRGEQFDTDLGLYYLRARYYNPLTGRFMSRDQNDPQLIDSDGVPTDPASLHKYLYAGGDPINGLDPSGKAAIFEYKFNIGGIGFRVALDPANHPFFTLLGKLYFCIHLQINSWTIGVKGPGWVARVPLIPLCVAAAP
jgi:RHS repeat-associated protein